MICYPKFKDTMNAIITNKHHFCEGITLTIKDGKLTWSVDRDAQKYKYGTVPLHIPYADRHGILDPKNSLDDFIKLLNLVFEFTGTLTYNKRENNAWVAHLTKNLQISDPDLSTKSVVETIYNTPLEHEVKFVEVSHCGCNMGHCGAITGVDVDSHTYKTYGEVMALIGTQAIVDDFTYYEYPDSVLLDLEKATEFPDEIHDGYSCCYPKKKLDNVWDPNTVYLSYGFSR
jgi:hypothetical protein